MFVGGAEQVGSVGELPMGGIPRARHSAAPSSVDRWVT